MMTVMTAGHAAATDKGYPMQTDDTDWQAVIIPQASQRLMRSAITNKDYLIQVATIGERPANGYPVVYVLDGNAFFAPSVSIAQMLHGRPAQTQPKSLMIVGIGYPTDKQFDIANRAHDYTPPADSYPKPKGEQTAFGGAERFYEFIEQELTPMLDDKFGINPNHRSLVGHSFGGLFGLYVLMKHGQSFNHYVIASPSIWWNDKSILAYKDALIATPNIRHILITLGEHELSATHKDPSLNAFGVTDSLAHQMAQFLAHCLTGAQVDFSFHPNFNHGMNAYPSLVHGLAMIYQSCQADERC
ncbi:hypothetical protein LU290_00930 [Moraxella nasibovis]|uniref:alpha/beta hydrolase n=1 Tax=Moraxella nasibovis TaxID=2904120 RepID=UPI00240F72AF|nr:alpha/beta hydrolase-fold protein [Moraxella nasibovis]WFF38842.1 hypothetical protein LU290_00930 [Moraxella nasibovis]